MGNNNSLKKNLSTRNREPASQAERSSAFATVVFASKPKEIVLEVCLPSSGIQGEKSPIGTDDACDRRWTIPFSRISILPAAMISPGAIFPLALSPFAPSFATNSESIISPFCIWASA